MVSTLFDLLSSKKVPLPLTSVEIFVSEIICKRYQKEPILALISKRCITLASRGAPKIKLFFAKKL
jgi:hypothetical protein